MSTLSYLTPNFTPFQSSGGMCYPSTDYAGINQRGGGNYCGDGLIPTSTGKNMYLATDYGVDYDKVSKDNYGIDYSTAFGGAKMNKGKKSKKTKETKKKSTTAKKKKTTIESDWKDYYGSNKELKADVELLGAHNFRREILRLCKTKGECNYYEAKMQFSLDVLEDKGYYNEWISVKVSRSHIPK